MGNVRKNLFWSELFPNINCSLCRILQQDTWLHLLLCCTELHIHKLHINRRNKAIQEIHKFLISNIESQCYILMNVGKTDAQPQENTVPHWLQKPQKVFYYWCLYWLLLVSFCYLYRRGSFLPCSRMLCNVVRSSIYCVGQG